MKFDEVVKRLENCLVEYDLRKYNPDFLISRKIVEFISGNIHLIVDIHNLDYGASIGIATNLHLEDLIGMWGVYALREILWTKHNFETSVKDYYLELPFSSSVRYLGVGFYNVSEKELSKFEPLAKDYFEIEQNFHRNLNVPNLTIAQALMNYHEMMVETIEKEKEFKQKIEDLKEGIDAQYQLRISFKNMLRGFFS